MPHDFATISAAAVLADARRPQMNADDLACIDGWLDVRAVALDLAGSDEDGQCQPSAYQWRKAASLILGDDEFAWDVDMRDALMQHGVDLACSACKGDGGCCGCGSPHCNCNKCEACEGSGVEVWL